jgi:hypothetical protein
VWDLQNHRSLFGNRGEFLGGPPNRSSPASSGSILFTPRTQTRVQHAWQSAHQEYQPAVEFRLQRQENSYACMKMRLRPLLTPPAAPPNICSSFCPN